MPPPHRTDATCGGHSKPPVRRETCPHKQSPVPHKPGLSSCPEATLKRCTEDGCDKKLVARGLCSTHYNRKYQPNRHRPKTRPCAWCGTPVTGSGGGGRKMGAACSTACRRHLLALALRGGSKAEGKALIAIAEQREAKTDRRPRPAKPARKRWFAGACAVCSAPFISPHFEKTCGDDCTELKRRGDRSEAKYRRRALERSAFVSAVNRHEIFRRDNWTCWLCHEQTDPDADPQSDHAPSLDHIIPLANGGTHEPGNVATAHRGCNARRTNLPTLANRAGERVAVLF
jgi:hypothetical protein